MEEEKLERVVSSLRAQYEAVAKGVREQAEKLLNDWAASPAFISQAVQIMALEALPEDIRKACGILLDKKIMSLSNIKALSDEELTQAGKILIEGVCSPKIPISLKCYVSSALQSVTYGQIEYNLAWKLFIPDIWKLIGSLKPELIYGGLMSLTAIISGSHSLNGSAESPDEFLSKLEELGLKLQADFESGHSMANGTLWEILRSYFKLFLEVVNYSVKQNFERLADVYSAK